MRSRAAAVALAVAAIALAPVPASTMAASAPSYPSVIALPDDFAPEGIATVNHRFFSGSLIDGDIYRGSLRSGEGSIFIDVSERQSLGLKVDRRHHLLFVAGGFNGHGYVYDLRTGADVADFAFGTPGASLVNDVVVTRSAAYFTETFGPYLYKVPIGADGSLGSAETITVTGPASVAVPGTFGINGIDATANGRTLFVCHTDLGKLFTVDPVTGASNEITITSGSLLPGTLDGILRVGHNLWVVQNFANVVSRVHLSPHWSTGAVTATVTNDAFQVPTTVARHGKRLVVVNAKFDLGFPPPIGPGAPPGTPFEAVQFKP